MAMNLTTSFTVPLPMAESWTLLQDMERVARWFPGATLEGVEEDIFTGTVRVKLGPMMVDYRGSARFVERDEGARRVILEASGREQRGTGVAKAVAATQLEADRAGTAVSVSVELDISGRPAQLGQGLMQDVAQRLVAEFSERMRADLENEGNRAGSIGRAERAIGAKADGKTPAEPRRGDSDVLDLGRVVGPELLRRALPFGATLVALVAVAACWSLRRARDKRR